MADEKPKARRSRGSLGAPPKPLSLHRRNRVMLNFTDSELAGIRRLARPAKQRPSVYLRDVILDHLRRRGERERQSRRVRSTGASRPAAA